MNIKVDNESALKLVMHVYFEVLIRTNRNFDLFNSYKSNSL